MFPSVSLEMFAIPIKKNFTVDVSEKRFEKKFGILMPTVGNTKNCPNECNDKYNLTSKVLINSDNDLVSISENGSGPA